MSLNNAVGCQGYIALSDTTEHWAFCDDDDDSGKPKCLEKSLFLGLAWDWTWASIVRSQ